MSPIFITGIGTGIGKTIISAIVTEALQADYWKPIQAGFEEGTDADLVKSLLTNTQSIIRPEVYKLKMPASPHIAAREEGVEISLPLIVKEFETAADRLRLTAIGTGGERSTVNIKLETPLVIEGAGGIMVPLNNKEFMIDLVEQLNAKVILVSRNYLGSINHSLLTAAICKQRNIEVLGWIFNDQYLDYEEEIVEWSGYPKIASIPFVDKIDKAFVLEQAGSIRLRKW